MAATLFGTDGIRGPANRYPVTPQLALELGALIGSLFRSASGPTKVVVGRDTRLSGPMLEAALTAGLLSAGAEVIPLGVVPTPAVALLTSTLGAAAGVVLSASHNPFEDNGLKIFQGNGLKCDDALEQKIEAALLAGPSAETLAARPAGNGLGRITPLADAAARYEAAVLASWPDGSLKGMKIAVDAANGAACETTPAVLRRLGAEVHVFHDRPDGTNINRACGSTHPEVIEKLVKQTGAHIGISHDGDADRVICCDETGSALDGDELLAVVGLDLLRRGQLKEKTLVATVMSNLALDELFAREGGAVRRSAVGDRAVLEEMLAHGLNFGGEQSGHVILLDHATTGDGLLSALALLRVARESGRPLSALRRELVKYPQLLLGLKVREKVPFEQVPGVLDAVREVEKQFGAAGRVFLRYSGTEPKARLLLEVRDGENLPALAEKILAPLRAAIGA
jgi:phosphoglucosamine mutase